mgnify:CR=1 FL=1
MKKVDLPPTPTFEELFKNTYTSQQLELMKQTRQEAVDYNKEIDRQNKPKSKTQKPSSTKLKKEKQHVK